MKLSIIIVNYNVRYFLEQTLRSVYSSLFAHSFEVFVVDNNSSDDSVDMVRQVFPQVRLYALKDNLGFSKGNNYAIRKAAGEYILLLNPDTILREDSLQKSIDYMDAHQDCGGLGIRMIDGRGNFLAESKRGVPTPMTSFYKMSGISSLFPTSKHFNAYHQGHLSEFDSDKVEILAGAYMMLRKSVLDEIGLLDEEFFMYGEDIDLSYRILKAGYYNYYLAESEIIHFKGESTRKASFNYVKLFHKAMIQFAQKHYGHLGGLYVVGLRLAIYLKAIASLVGRWLEKIIMPVIDFVVLWFLGIGVTRVWGTLYYGVERYYTAEFTLKILPISISVLIMVMGLFGAYDKPSRLRKLLSGLSVGVLGVLAFYGLLGENLRSSRAVISLLLVSGLVVLPLVRALINLFLYGQFTVEYKEGLRYIIVGSEEMREPIQQILQNQNRAHDFIGMVNVDSESGQALGQVKDIKAIVRAHNVNEVFFCTNDISRGAIMHSMAELGPETKYRIVEDSGANILGSDSKNKQGHLYTHNVHYKITTPENKRAKRLLDIFVALLLLLLFPLTFFLVKNIGTYARNILNVLIGKKTWISYAHENKDLPFLKPGILSTENVYEHSFVAGSMAADELYARDYSLWNDLTTILRNLSSLSN